MTDALGRQIDYLRLSVTDRCNLRCRYCMPRDIPSVSHNDILRYEEIVRLCRIAAGLGIRNIKVTGGEPLVRKGCTGLIGELKKIPGIEHVTLTTNGVLLGQQLDGLLDARIDGINISLDTLNPRRYAHVTGFDCLAQVLASMEKAVAAGVGVKINCVPLAETPEAELLQVAQLAAQWPVDVRFIEMMPIGSANQVAACPMDEVERLLYRQWPDLTPSAKKRGFGPARYYTASGLQGSIGLIDAVSHSFCGNCNRVRVTSEGFLKLCLSSGDGIDLRRLLRSGAQDGEISAAMQAAILRKPASHHFSAGAAETRQMWQIGG